MNNKDFGTLMKRLKEADGKEVFEHSTQYLVMAMTDKQVSEIAKLMLEWGYEPVYCPIRQMTFLQTKNGINLKLKKGML